MLESGLSWTQIFLSGCSFVLGVTLGVTLIRSKMRAAVEAARADTSLQAATLNERLTARDSQIEHLFKELKDSENTTDIFQQENSTLRAQAAELGERLRGSEERVTLLQTAEERLGQAFKALSSDALRSNNQSFLELANSTFEKLHITAQGDLTQRQQAIDVLVKPIQDALTRVDTKIQEIETNRVATFSALSEQLKGVASTQANLKDETANLSKALRAPHVRGRWGEIQLKRVVEMAGMVEYCDFTTQESSSNDEGKVLRPDLIIRLPNNKRIVVDSKAPLAGYLDSLEAPDEEIRVRKIADHARHIRTHLGQLSQKNYWAQFDPAPEFVVLFLPGETFFSAALQADPELIEAGVNQNIILATPTTLIALLRAVAFGWRQESLAKNAEEISKLGRDLYERIRIFSGHFVAVRSGLEKAIDGYNKAASSLESRVMVTARRFKELGSSTSEQLEVVQEVQQAPRMLDLPEITPTSETQRID